MSRSSRRSRTTKTTPTQPATRKHESFFLAEEYWGQNRFRIGYPEHIQVRQIVVPEGFALVCCCLQCGSREEIVADLRPLMMVSARDSSWDVDDFDFLRPSPAWLDAHATCTAPLAPLSRDLHKFVLNRLCAAELVVRDHILSPAWFILRSDGSNAQLIPEPKLPDSEDDLLKVMIARQFELREMMRNGRLAASAALVIMDYVADDTTPLPPQLTGIVQPGDDGLLLQLVTPTSARSCWVPVDRSAHGAKAPIPSKSLFWSPEGASLFIAGILAKTELCLPPDLSVIPSGQLN